MIYLRLIKMMNFTRNINKKEELIHHKKIRIGKLLLVESIINYIYKKLFIIEIHQPIHSIAMERMFTEVKVILKYNLLKKLRLNQCLTDNKRFKIQQQIDSIE